MFKFSVGILALLLALRVFSGTVTTQIREVDVGDGNESVLVFLSNGGVAKLQAHSDLISALQMASEKKTLVKVTLNDEREVLSVQSQRKLVQGEIEQHSLAPRAYSPSTIPTYEKALSIFKGMNRKSNEESQCYNRAHVWSYEMYNDHHVRAMKIFVFFTKKYIRRYNFEWWFHVSPYVMVNEEGQSVERVMDFKYTRRPLLMKEWTDVFTSNNAKCKDIEKYTDYEYNRESSSSEWCMLLRSSAYYYQPLDLEKLDKNGQGKDFWVDWEVSNAYREAFSYRH